MKRPSVIACVGWGSLLWRPETLPIQGEWASDGPRLPIEFARISSDGRLTLIVYPEAKPIGTYWVPLAVSDLEEGIEALARRERCRPHHIGRWAPDQSEATVHPQVLPIIASWARERALDGVVWTDLPPMFEERSGRRWTPNNAADYVLSLTDETVRKRALRYIQNAPPQTRTRTRRRIERRLRSGQSASGRRSKP